MAVDFICLSQIRFQACVRERAVNSILCVKDIEKSEAENVVDSVFASCFYNTEPFEHVPP